MSKVLGLWGIVSLMIILVSFSFADETYVSLYPLGQTVQWCSALNQGACAEDGLCPYIFSAPQECRYHCQEHLRGFANIYNPADPRLVCGYKTESVNLGQCLSEGAWTLVEEVCGFSHQKCRVTSQVPIAFRLFLPPGTKRILVVMNFWRDAEAGVAVRFKLPPVAYQDLPADFEAVPWEGQGEIAAEKLFTQEVYFRNVAGTLRFYATLERPLSEGEAGWLYFRLLPQFQQEAHTFKAYTTVDYLSYALWYQKIKSCSSQAPSFPFCWDEQGDPKVIQLGCDASHLEQCKDEAACEAAGGHWWAGACHAEPLQKPKASLTCLPWFGKAALWLSIEDCGSFCNRAVKVLIGATDPSHSRYFSWNPSSGWQEGLTSFDLLSLPTVNNYDLLQGLSVSIEAIAGWQAGFAIDLNGDGKISLDELLAETVCQSP